MNKNIFAGLAASALALALATASSSAVANNAAIVIDDTGCGFLDGYGNYAYFPASHAVSTSGGTTTVKCYATGVPREPGKAIRYSGGSTGLTCYTEFGDATDRWWEVIDSEGNATVTCQTKR